MPVEIRSQDAIFAISALSVALLAALAWLVRGPPAECTVVEVDVERTK